MVKHRMVLNSSKLSLSSQSLMVIIATVQPLCHPGQLYSEASVDISLATVKLHLLSAQHLHQPARDPSTRMDIHSVLFHSRAT